jgi:hypothetical protein
MASQNDANDAHNGPPRRLFLVAVPSSSCFRGLFATQFNK